MNKKYTIEIYEPGSLKDVLAHFESDHPFLQISKGDIINPRLFKGWDSPKILKVLGVEHFLWQDGVITKHKICLITELVDDTPIDRGLMNG